MQSTSEEELKFYNNDGSYKTIVAKKSLTANKACQLLVVQNNVERKMHWVIVEAIEELGLERSLEQNEDILEIVSKQPSTKLYFRKDYDKAYYPRSESPSSYLWILRNVKKLWKKAKVSLVKRTLYCSFSSKSKKESYCADLGKYNIYRLTRKSYDIPTEYGFCLKPHQTNDAKEMYFACDNDSTRIHWLAELRLAKFGKKLCDHFKRFTVRNNPALSEDTEHLFEKPLTEIFTVNQKAILDVKKPDENDKWKTMKLKTHVLMDFTGGHGQIAKDPEDSHTIGGAEGFNLNKVVMRKVHTTLTDSDCGAHVTQPWYHGKISREYAAQLLMRDNSKNGTFLVRNSSRSGIVLSMVHERKLHHVRIVIVDDSEHIVYSVDSGRTRFFSVLQLVRFYELNQGCLPTRLNYYITQCKDIVKV